MQRENSAVLHTRGIAARRLAVFVIDAVIARKRALDEAMTEGIQRLHLDDLAPRDRAFARLLATTSLRHHGRLHALVDGYLDKPLPEDAGRTMAVLVVAAAQLVLLDTPPHAAISMAVDIARLDHTARRFDRLVNAILRRIATDGKANFASLDAMRDCPAWLAQRWMAAYGEATARDIVRASLLEPPLDVTVKSDAAAWAAKLSGTVIGPSTVRIREAGRIEDLPGFDEGAWWVQDAAAALPARLLAVTAGERVADLCAAPGGKTAQLAIAGATVVAVDSSPKRMARLDRNLQRLRLSVTSATEAVEAFTTKPENVASFDAVLLDAPCSATGTVRRHPDLMHLKTDADVTRLAALQGPLLAAAAGLLKPQGRLVYATCSLEPAEGIEIIEAFLADNPLFVRDPLAPDRDRLPAALITAQGDLRTLPFHALGDDPVAAGMDGFYAARLRRLS